MENTDALWQPVDGTTIHQLLADIHQLCQNPPVPQTPDHVRVRRQDLAFYKLMALYELVVPDPDPAAEATCAYVLWGPALLLPLDGTPHPVLRLNTELAADEAFLLTADTALDYLRFWFDWCTNGQLALCSGLRATGRDDDTLPAQLQAEPLRLVALGRDGFQARVLVRQHQTTLLDTLLHLNRDGWVDFHRPQPLPANAPPLPGPAAAPPRPGKLLRLLTAEAYEDTGRRQTSHSRLKLQELLPRYLPTQAMPERQVVDFEWAEILPQNHRRLIAALNQQCGLRLKSTACHSRVSVLPFYELLDLYEVRTQPPKGVPPGRFVPRCYYVLWGKNALWRAGNYRLFNEKGRDVELGGQLLQPLSLDYQAIYQVNGELSRLGGLRLTPETVPAYVRFYLSYVVGRHGYFNMVDQLQLQLGEDDEGNPSPGRQEYTAQFPALQAFAVANEPYRLQAYMQFKDYLFTTVALVEPSGAMLLNNEHLVGKVLTTVGLRTPYDKLALPGRYAHRRQQSLLRITLDERRRVAERPAGSPPAEAGGVPWGGAEALAAWERVAAPEFLRRMQPGSAPPHNLTKLYVTGRVVLTEAHLHQGRIWLTSCYFEEQLTCEVVDDKMDFRAENCFFRGGLVFERGWTGPIYLQACHLFPAISLTRPATEAPAVSEPAAGAPPPIKNLPQEQELLVAKGLTIAGDVELNNVHVEGKVNLEATSCVRLRVYGCLLEAGLQATMLACRGIELHTYAKGVLLDKSTVQGDLDLLVDQSENISLLNAVITGSVRINELNSGYLYAPNLQCGLLEIRGAGSRLTDTAVQWINIEGLRATSLLVEDLTIRNTALNELGSLDVSESRVQGSLTISNVAIAGYLQGDMLLATSIMITGVVVTEDKQLAGAGAGSVYLNQATVSGDITVRETSLSGRLSMSDLTVGQQLHLLGVQIGESLVLRRSVVERGIRLASWYRFGPGSNQGVDIGKNLNLKQVKAGAVRLSPCRIRGNLNAKQAQFGSFEYWPGLVQLPLARRRLLRPRPWPGKHPAQRLWRWYPPRYRLRHSQVGGSAWLSGAVIAGHLDWMGVAVAGSLNAKLLRVQGDLRFATDAAELRNLVGELYREHTGIMDTRLYEEAKLAATALVLELPAPEPGRLTQYFRTAIGGHLDLHAMQLGGMLHLAELQVGGGVNLSAAHIGDTLTMARARLNGLCLSHSSVRHDMEISFLEVSAPPGGAAAGKADWTALTVGGQLRCEATRLPYALDLTDANLTRGLHAAAPAALPASQYPALELAGNLLLRSATSQEIIDLTDLVLTPTTHDPLPGLLADNLTVEGELRLSNARSAARWPTARIPGSIDLERAKLRRLILSDESHPTDRPTVDGGDEIVLKSARVGILTVLNPPPSPLSLSGLTVEEWDFQPPSTPQFQLYADKRRKQKQKYGRMAEDAKDYVLFLNQSEKVQKSLYRAVEKQLYDEGNEQASDDVYRVMWLRDYENQRQQELTLRLLFNRALHGFFGYFTYVPRLTRWFLVGWFVLSAIIFSQRQNIVAAESTLAAARDQLADSSLVKHPAPAQARQRRQAAALLASRQPGADWGWPGGLLLALRYHLPIVPIALHEEWSPADTPGITLLPAQRLGAYFWPGWHLPWPSPNGYARGVAWAHWFIIPIIGIIVSRRILKRAKQT